MTALLPLALALAAPPAAAGDARPVAAVSQARAIRLSDSPVAYQIEAAGTVPTAGWTNPRLEPMNGEIGVQTFTFVATPPDRPAVPEPERIEAWTRWTPADPAVRRIRIRAGDNAVEIRLPGS